MQIKEISQQEYKNLVKEYVTVFETPDFNNLNREKCNKVLYLLFTNEKYRFGLIAGIKENGILSIPFSAPYSMFTSIRRNNKIKEYSEAVKFLIEFCRTNALKEIQFTLPPKFYNESHISNIENALFEKGFSVDKVDLNYHYNLEEFDENYIKTCDIKARQKINAALKADLFFEKVETDDCLKETYEIIKNNRTSKGYPLHLSFEDIKKTVQIVPADFFIVRDSKNNGIASAIIFNVTKNTVQVIYWGNIEGIESLRPMNYLAYKIFEYYKMMDKKIVDIGPSTENSAPNFGLCDFKQAIGCKTNTKYTFSYKIQGKI